MYQGKFIKYFFLLVFAFLITFILFPTFKINAAPVYDYTEGIYTDDFAVNTGVPTRSYVNVNTTTGVLQLTNTTTQTSFVALSRQNFLL